MYVWLYWFSSYANTILMPGAVNWYASMHHQSENDTYTSSTSPHRRPLYAHFASSIPLYCLVSCSFLFIYLWHLLDIVFTQAKRSLTVKRFTPNELCRVGVYAFRHDAHVMCLSFKTQGHANHKTYRHFMTYGFMMFAYKVSRIFTRTSWCGLV